MTRMWTGSGCQTMATWSQSAQAASLLRSGRWTLNNTRYLRVVVVDGWWKQHLVQGHDLDLEGDPELDNLKYSDWAHRGKAGEDGRDRASDPEGAHGLPQRDRGPQGHGVQCEWGHEHLPPQVTRYLRDRIVVNFDRPRFPTGKQHYDMLRTQERNSVAVLYQVDSDQKNFLNQGC